VQNSAGTIKWVHILSILASISKEDIMKKLAIFLACILFIGVTAQAAVVTVTAVGTVVWNGIDEDPLGAVNPGDRAIMTLQVDSNNFVEMLPGDVRGYDLIMFDLSFSSGAGLGLLPGAPTAYFNLVEGFPISDGFFVSESAVSPGGVQLEQVDYQFNLDLGYEGDTLETLDIGDALGYYDFSGLTRFGFNIWRIVPDNVQLDIDFEYMMITSPIPEVESSWGAVKSLYR
jgi:hypothetical protein